MKPNFLIIGAPRCGTTYLARNLATHPEIYVATGAEQDIAGDVHFFDPGTPEGRTNQARGEDWYHGLFSGAENTTAVGEKTADYLVDPEAPELIAQSLDRPALVVMIRDPVERAWSHFCHSRHRLPPRTRFPDIVHSGQDIADVPVLDAGLYARHLERFIQRFGRANILVVVKEDLERNAGAELARVSSFLGVSPDYSFPHIETYINAGSASRLAQVTARLGRGLRTRLPRAYEWLVSGPLSNPVQRLIRLLRGKNGLQHDKETPASRKRPDVHSRRALRAYYRADVHALSRMLERDLVSLWWGNRENETQSQR